MQTNHSNTGDFRLTLAARSEIYNTTTFSAVTKKLAVNASMLINTYWHLSFMPLIYVFYHINYGEQKY